MPSKTRCWKGTLCPGRLGLLQQASLWQSCNDAADADIQVGNFPAKAGWRPNFCWASAVHAGLYAHMQQVCAEATGLL